MKKIIVLTIAILFSCTFTLKAEKIKGNGKVVIKKVEISAFEKLSIEGIFNVILVQGTTASMTIEADENLIPLVESSVTNNKLTVKSKEKTEVEKFTKFNVIIVINDISEINFSGIGNLSCQNLLKQNNLKLSTSGVGNTEINVQLKKINIQADNVGSLTLKGSADEMSIKNNGVGHVLAFGFDAGILKFEGSGVGNSQLNASKEIYIQSSGIGSVSYKGNAVVKQSEATGMGKITKVN